MKGAGVAIGSLAKVSRTAESVLDLYGGARAFAAANTVGVASRGARLGARSLVGSVDEFSQAAFTGLRRGLSRLSGASQYAVIRQVRSVPADTKRAVADGGVSEAAVGFLARQRDDAGEVAESVEPEQFGRIVTTRKALTDGGRTPDEANLGETNLVGFLLSFKRVERSEVLDKLARYRAEVSTRGPFEAQDTLAAAFRRSDRGTAFVREASPELLADISERGLERKVAVLAELGISPDVVRRIRDGKIVRPGNRPAGDFDALSELSEQTLSRVQYYAQRTQDGSGVIGEQGDAAEFVAEEKFLNDLGYSVDEYEVYSGVEIQDGNDDSLEIDHLVVHKDTGKVVALGETKSEGSVDNFDEATDQLKEDTEFISQSELDIINVDRGPRGQSHLASNVKFPDSPAEDLDRLFAFGPGT